MRVLSVCALALVVSGCATRYLAVPFPTYEYAGIDLGATITGEPELADSCLTMRPILDGVAQAPVNLIMPLGTQLRGNSLVLPEENGGDTIRIGSRITFQGGYNTIDGEQTYARNPGGCSGSAFIVNRVYSD